MDRPHLRGADHPGVRFRHYIQDKGVFPKDMMEDMHLGKEERVESEPACYLT